MNIYEILNKLNIKYQEVEHQAAYTVEQIQEMNIDLDGIGCKNLFLTDKKGKYFLVTIEENKRVNIKEVEKITNSKHLSFASKEELKEILSLEPGSVTPLSIINDHNNKVIVVLDEYLKNNKILVHPNINTKTISIDFADLIKLIEYENHQYILMKGNVL